MENGIYISKLNKLIKEIENIYKLDIFFVEIFGKRFSFIAGDEKKLKITQYVPVKITQRIGVVFPSDIDEKLRKEIFEYILKYIDEEGINGM